MLDSTTAAELELPGLLDWFHPPALEDPQVPERFWEKVRTDGPMIEAMPHLGPCWPWQGGKTGSGYGQFYPNGSGEHVRAHRYLWIAVYGEIPEGLTPDHLCHSFDPTCPGGKTCPHRACLSLLHLEVVTHGLNVRRGVKHWSAKAAWTHCKRGHEFTPENTYWRSNGTRTCRTCQREHDRRYRASGRARERDRRYRAKHPDRVRESVRRSRANKTQSAGRG
jgi:hypothetical protein